MVSSPRISSPRTSSRRRRASSSPRRRTRSRGAWARKSGAVPRRQQPAAAHRGRHPPGSRGDAGPAEAAVRRPGSGPLVPHPTDEQAQETGDDTAVAAAATPTRGRGRRRRRPRAVFRRDSLTCQNDQARIEISPFTPDPAAPIRKGELPGLLDRIGGLRRDLARPVTVCGCRRSGIPRQHVALESEAYRFLIHGREGRAGQGCESSTSGYLAIGTPRRAPPPLERRGRRRAGVRHPLEVDRRASDGPMAELLGLTVVDAPGVMVMLILRRDPAATCGGSSLGTRRPQDPGRQGPGDLAAASSTS